MKLINVLVASFLLLSCGCGREAETDCDKGLCGVKWAQELDSALAHAEGVMRLNPNDSNALLSLAQACVERATLMCDEGIRGDFWLSSNLRRVNSLLDTAIVACDNALSRNESFGRAYLLKGRSYQLRGHIARTTEEWDKNSGMARANLVRATSLEPASPEAWYGLGLYYEQFHDAFRREATHCFEKAVAIDPHSARAIAYLCVWPDSERTRYYPMVRRLGSNDPEVLRLLARAGNGYDGDEYLKSTRFVPDFAKLPIVVAIPWFLNFDLSARYYEIVRSEHHLLSDHLELSQCLQWHGNSTDAARQLKIWGDKTLGFAEPYYYDATNTLVQAPRIDPTSSWVYIIRGRAYDVGPDTAVGLFSKAISLDSSSALPYYLLAATYAEKKDWPSAERWLRETLRKCKGNEFITVNAELLSGFVSGRQGNVQKVMQDISLALQSDSGYVVSRILEGGMFGRRYLGPLCFSEKPIGLGSIRTPREKRIASLLNFASGRASGDPAIGGWDTTRCIKFLQMAIDLDAQNLDAWYLLASMRAYTGEYVKGVDIIQKFLQRDPNNARAHRALGEIYLEAHLLDKARQELQSAYDLGSPLAKVILDGIQESKKQ